MHRKCERCEKRLHKDHRFCPFCGIRAGDVPLAGLGEARPQSFGLKHSRNPGGLADVTSKQKFFNLRNDTTFGKRK